VTPRKLAPNATNRPTEVPNTNLLGTTHDAAAVADDDDDDDDDTTLVSRELSSKLFVVDDDDDDDDVVAASFSSCKEAATRNPSCFLPDLTPSFLLTDLPAPLPPRQILLLHDDP
jgi:hypothetical protein